MLISIIIPVYNPGEKLINLFNSLSRQISNDVEVIIIDDGSLNPKYDFFNKYSSFNVYYKSNGGVASARNLGLTKVNGEYIAFCDQDDSISDDYIITLKSLISTHMDFYVSSKIYRFVNKKDITFIYDEKIVDDYQTIQEMLFLNRSQIFSTIWNCIYKKSIIENNNLKFDEKLKFGGEDSLFNIDYVRCINNVSIVNKVYYTYHIYESGNTITKENSHYLQDYQCFIDHLFPVSHSLEKEVYDYVFRCGLHSYIKAFKGKVKMSISERIDVANKIAIIPQFRTGLSITRATTNKMRYHNILKLLILTGNRCCIWMGFEINRMIVKKLGKVSF